jgi:diaminopimelate decarboxylase
MSYKIYQSGTLDTFYNGSIAKAQVPNYNFNSKSTNSLMRYVNDNVSDISETPEMTNTYDTLCFTDKLEDFLDREDSIYIYDLLKLKTLYKRWQTLFPYIKPHYAVKCNPDIEILKTLAKCGASFDCASPAEIESVLNLKVSPRRIIYANPCKKNQDILYAVNKGIQYTTFDTLCELEKIYRIAPNMKLIMRIYANDPSAQCILK